jgi:hypothetical protein
MCQLGSDTAAQHKHAVTQLQYTHEIDLPVLLSASRMSV